MNEELTNYIKGQLNAGTSTENIKKILLQTGWDEATVDEAIKTTSNVTTASASAETNEPRVMSTTTNSTLIPNKQSHQKGLIIGIVSILLLIIIGGGLSAYFKFLRITPDQVLANMSKSMATVQSGRYETKLSAILSIPKNEFEEIKQFVPITSNKIDLLISGATVEKDNKTQTESTTEILNEQTKLISFDHKVIDETIFFKLNSINIPIFHIFVNTDEFMNKWVQIGMQELIDESELTKQNNNTTPNFNDILTQIKALEKKYTQEKILSFQESFGEEKINGIPTYHYKVAIKKEIFEKLIDDLFLILGDETNKKEFEDAGKNIKKITLPPIDIWIGKKDFYIHKINFTIKLSDLNFAENTEIPFSPQDSISMIILLKDHNKEILINKPEKSENLKKFVENLNNNGDGEISINKETKTIEELDTEYMKKEDGVTKIERSNEIPTLFQNENLDPDKDGLTNDLEFFYGTNEKNADTDGDGYTDGDEIKNGYNPKGPGKLK